jgi:hypothetical protein
MRTALTAAGLAVTLMATAGTEQSMNTSDATTVDTAQGNVLLEEWTGGYGGVPAFGRMDLEALEPALVAAMSSSLVEIDAIAECPDAPTFENTIEAMERAGRDLQRVLTYWGIWSSNLSSPEFRAIQKRMVPQLSEFQSKITQNRDLFDRRALHGHQPAARGAAHAIREQRAGRRGGVRPVPESGPTFRLADVVRAGGGGCRRRSRPGRGVRDHEHSLLHGSVPDVLGRARPP